MRVSAVFLGLLVIPLGNVEPNREAFAPPPARYLRRFLARQPRPLPSMKGTLPRFRPSVHDGRTRMASPTVRQVDGSPFYVGRTADYPTDAIQAALPKFLKQRRSPSSKSSDGFVIENVKTESVLEQCPLLKCECDDMLPNECETATMAITPAAADNVLDNRRWIVQNESYSQVVTVARCREEMSECSLFGDGRCKTKACVRPLAVLDERDGRIKIEYFKYNSCCVCQHQETYF